MLLVLKIGNIFFSFLSSLQPTLHSLACGLLFQFLHLWREASWLSFAVRQSCFLVWISALSYWVQFFCLLTAYCTSFSLLSLLWFLGLLSFCGTKFSAFFLGASSFLLFKTCHLWIISGKTSCINNSLWCAVNVQVTTGCLCTWLFSLSPCIAQAIVRAEHLLLEKEEITQPSPNTISYEKSLMFCSLVPQLPD